MKLIKCYYCGGYFDEEEAIGWDVCASCAVKEEDEYHWYEEEREDYILGDIDDYDLPNITVQLAQYGEDDE